MLVSFNLDTTEEERNNSTASFPWKQEQVHCLNIPAQKYKALGIISALILVVRTEVLRIRKFLSYNPCASFPSFLLSFFLSFFLSFVLSFFLSFFFFSKEPPLELVHPCGNLVYNKGLQRWNLKESETFSWKETLLQKTNKQNTLVEKWHIRHAIVFIVHCNCWLGYAHNPSEVLNNISSSCMYWGRGEGWVVFQHFHWRERGFVLTITYSHTERTLVLWAWRSPAFVESIAREWRTQEKPKNKERRV